MTLARRAVLGGAGGLVLAGAVGGLIDVRVLPGRGHLERALGLASDVDGLVPTIAAGTVVTGSLSSVHLGHAVGWAIAYPPGVRPGSPLPVALALPGKGGTATSLLSSVGYPHFLASYVHRGGARFAIAAVDGGDTYWHPRRSGDALGMLIDELLPLLERRSLRTAEFGVLGVSMGGYGSLLLARQSARRQLGGRTLVVAAASSPALWTSAGATAPGAFDDAADWQRWGDLVADPGLATSTAVWVACGDSDPFAAADRAYRAAAGVTAGGFSPGAHDPGYWRSVAAAQVAFVGAHLG